MCAQVESGVLETFIVVTKEYSKRRSGCGGSHGGAGRLACQSPRETPVWFCVHKAGLCQPCMLSGGPLCGASSLFLHILACVAYFNVYICHIHRVINHDVRFWRGVVHGPRATRLAPATDGSVAVTSYEQSRETCPENQGHICVPGPFSFQRF